MIPVILLWVLFFLFHLYLSFFIFHFYKRITDRSLVFLIYIIYYYLLCFLMVYLSFLSFVTIPILIIRFMSIKKRKALRRAWWYSQRHLRAFRKDYLISILWILCLYSRWLTPGTKNMKIRYLPLFQLNNLPSAARGYGLALRSCYENSYKIIFFIIY